METRANYISVGAFVLILIAAAMAFILWMSRIDFEDNKKSYLIYFVGSVAGLRVNDSVRFHGIPIGTVKQIAVDKSNVERVVVEVAIEDPTLIREDAVAYVEAQGLTGYSYIHIKGGSQASPILKKKPGETHPIIASKPSNLEMVFGSLPDILEKIYDLSDRFNRLLSDQNLKDLTESFQNFSHITEKLSSGSTSLDALIHQTHKTLLSFETTLKGVNQSLSHRDLQNTLSSITQAARELDRFLEENRGSVQQFTSVGLEDFTRLMGETRETVSTLNRVLLDLERSPGNFLNKNTTQGYRP